MIGRWSEESSEDVVHSDLMERSGLPNVTSGEVGWVLLEKGLRVGVFGSFMTGMLSSWLRRRVPLGSSSCEISQDESWALKSPAIMVLFGAARLLTSGW